MEWLKNTISIFFDKKPEGSISKQKLLAEFCLKWNISERTAKEFLKILSNTNFIEIKGDLINK